MRYPSSSSAGNYALPSSSSSSPKPTKEETCAKIEARARERRELANARRKAQAARERAVNNLANAVTQPCP